MSRPKADIFSISVVLATYNRRPLLDRAISSVLRQTAPPLEIIMIDDGSSDDTDPYIRKNFPSIRYTWQQNQGVSAARNQGIRQSKGEWIAFLDSDDEWLPKKLENQIIALQKQPQFRICHTNEIWIRRGKRVNPHKKHAKSGGDIFERCLPLCIISPSSVLIHRSIFKEYGVFDTSLPVCEDYDLWLRICAFEPVLYISTPQIKKYGGHENQLSQKYWGMDRFRIRALEKIIDNPQLPSGKRLAAIKVMVDKIDVYINGAQKRGKTKEVSEYVEKRDLFLQQLQGRK
jgi:glycosyltransferase involved in cell wall biosynthesis